MNQMVFQEITKLVEQYNEQLSRVVNALGKCAFDDATHELANMVCLCQYMLDCALIVQNNSSIQIVERILKDTTSLAVLIAKAKYKDTFAPEDMQKIFSNVFCSLQKFKNYH